MTSLTVIDANREAAIDADREAVIDVDYETVDSKPITSDVLTTAVYDAISIGLIVGATALTLTMSVAVVRIVTGRPH